MSASSSREIPAGGATTDLAPVGGDTAGAGTQVRPGAPGSQLPATGPIVLDASFVIALLQRDPGATALTHVLPRGVMTSVTAGEVFAAVAEAGGADPERVEGVLRALGVRVVELPLAATRLFPSLCRVDADRRAAQKADGEEVVVLSLADLCVLGYALIIGAPVLAHDQHWTALVASGLGTPIYLC